MIYRNSCFAFIVLLFSTFTALSQKNFSQADAKALSVKTYKNLKDLSEKLTSGQKSQLLKVRSVFRWITENIAYDTKLFHSDSLHDYYKCVNFNRTENARQNDSIYNTVILDSVLKRKAAICDGYSRLFKTLCDYAGIKSEIVIGMGKNAPTVPGKFSSNHAWNAVKIDTTWRLLDACWGSGYCDDSVTVFTKSFNGFYFLTDPKAMSYDHFPDEKKYFFHSNPFSKQQFLSMPRVLPGFFKAGFENFSPATALIKAKLNQKIVISIGKLVDEKGHWFQSSEGAQLKKIEKRFYIEQAITRADKENLIVYYQGEAILEYTLDIEDKGTR